jgi:uncharacterized radical SAM superfamily Fe-S cluster-containing enzyme
MKVNEKQLVDSILQIIDAYETAPGKEFISNIKATLAQVNYREVDPDTEVVISKAVYNELKDRAEEVFNEMTERMKAEIQIEKKMCKHKVDQACKEKALEIYIWFKNIFMNNETFDRGVFGWSTDDLMAVLEIFAKQFNIEV